MSRSYKKNPIVKDHTKDAKRMANRKVRRTEDVPNGCQYRRVYSQYDVCDWVWYKSLSKLKAHWVEEQAPHASRWAGKDTPAEYMNKWAKRYYWK